MSKLAQILLSKKKGIVFFLDIYVYTCTKERYTVSMEQKSYIADCYLSGHRDFS